MAGSKTYIDWLEGMKQLHLDKNAGYSPGTDPWSNFRMSETLGIPAWKGALVRMGDKYARVMALANNPDADKVGEAIEDTLSDLAAYAGIARDLYIEATTGGKAIVPAVKPPQCCSHAKGESCALPCAVCKPDCLCLAEKEMC